MAAAAVALLVAVPFVDFLSANVTALPSLSRIGIYYSYALALATLLAAVQAVLLRMMRMPGWRALPLAGVEVLMLFTYHEVRRFALAASPEIGYVPILAMWMGITAVATLITFAVVRTRRTIAGLLALAAIMAGPGASRVLPAAIAQREQLDAARKRAAERARISPNVYWILLDGYPRADVLASQFGWDNSAFLSELRSRGFSVQDEATANYPTTLQSVPATLTMDYLLSPDTPREVVRKLTGSQYAIIRGRNTVADRFRALGYRYVHFSNGYDHATLCGDTVDKCVVGSRGLDEVAVALLSRTPYIDASLTQKPLETADESGLMRGAVTDFESKLRIVHEVPRPFFVYAHILMPHPPFRYDRNCGAVRARPDLGGWVDKRRPEFLAQLECTNRQSLSLLDRIASRDPGALIVLQSDHGTAFLQPFSEPAREWSEAQIVERFSILSAVRMPPACADVEIPSNLGAVNTFRIAFSCLTGDAATLLPNRRFVTPEDNSPEFGVVIEY